MNSHLTGRRILVVEDEMLVSWLLEDMLSDLGCSVVGLAARVDQALTMIETVTFDAAVLDVNLNGQLSYPVADALVARGVPFLFSTGYAADRLLAAYQTFPMLQKPYHESDLGEALERLLTPEMLD